MVDVVGVIVGYRGGSDLECHHPGTSVAVEVRCARVVLDKSLVDIFFVVQTVKRVHVLVEYENVLVSDDDKVLLAVERIDQESISEDLREVLLTVERVFGWSGPRRTTHGTIKYEGFRWLFVATVCE